MIYNDVINEIVTPFIASVVVLVNTFVIFYVLKYRKTQQNPIAMVYIMNMALGDFFLGFITITLTFTDFIFEAHEEGTNYTYTIVRIMLIRLSLFISVINLIPLTLDRLWAVKYPISHRQSKRKFAVRVCIFVWILSTVVVGIFYSIIHFGMNKIQKLEKLLFSVVTFPTCLVFMICYVVIFRELKSSRIYRERTGSRSIPRTYSLSNQISNNSRRGSEITLTKIDERRSEVKFIHLAVKTMVVFIICWFPMATCGIPGVCSCGGVIESVFLLLGYVNALVTPLVYYSHFRHALKKKLRRFTFRSTAFGMWLENSNETLKFSTIISEKENGKK